MKLIKGLLAIALISVIAVSCNETKKEEQKAVEAPQEKVEAPAKAPEVVTVDVVEAPPVYPECEGTNEELKECLQKSIVKFVRKNFDEDLAHELELSEGEHKITVQFNINDSGTVTNVMAKAPNEALEKEAVRVIGSLPQMTPAKNNGAPVTVTYTLPIVFDVVD